MAEKKPKQQPKPTKEEKLAAELAAMRLCPGNDAHRYAIQIIELVHRFDADDEDIMAQLTQDDVDVEEIQKNQQAMMGGIVSMSKMITAMHDTMRRHFEASMTIGTIGKGGVSGGTDETETKSA